MQGITTTGKILKFQVCDQSIKLQIIQKMDITVLKHLVLRAGLALELIAPLDLNNLYILHLKRDF